MIAAAYLVLSMCQPLLQSCGGRLNPQLTTVVIPQASLDQCLRTANAYNKRKDRRAECVPAGEMP